MREYTSVDSPHGSFIDFKKAEAEARARFQQARDRARRVASAPIRRTDAKESAWRMSASARLRLAEAASR